MSSVRRFALCAALATSSVGCAAFQDPDAAYLAGREDVRAPSVPTLSLRFNRALERPFQGDLVPRERASVALDPRHDRIYVATSRGVVFALDGNGRTKFEYDAESELDATPVLDAARRLLYVPAMDGSLHAIDAVSGERKYKAAIGHPLAEEPLLLGDTLFAMADDDALVAIGVEDGGVLWTYRRPAAEEISVAGHAGIALVGDRIIAGFDDGMLAALRANDGAVFWELDTSLDLGASSGPLRLRDVDTTPAIIGDIAYVASFAGGLYAVDVRNGSVVHRDPEQTGITAIQVVDDELLVTSSDRGLSRLNPTTHEVRWTRPNDRGTPGRSCIVSGVAIFGESRGSLIAVRLEDGEEILRYESGNGFASEPRHAAGLVVTLSNGARLFGFDVVEPRPRR